MRALDYQLTARGVVVGLLVDDDPVFLQSARHALNENNLLVAMTGREALRMVGAIRFDAALVGLDLKRESGFDLIDEIHTKRPDMPIIAISGVFSGASLESAKAFGAARVLRKPATAEWQKLIGSLR